MTQDASPAAPPAAPDLKTLDEDQSIARFLDIVAEVIGVDTLDASEHFLDAGGDSLTTGIIIDWIGQESGVEPDFDWFFDSPSIREIANKWWAKRQEPVAVAPAGQ